MCPLQSTACAANKDGGQINVCKRYYTINHDHYETKLELFSFFWWDCRSSFFPQTVLSLHYITCCSMFGHLPASSCLHRLIKQANGQVWFHHVI